MCMSKCHSPRKLRVVVCSEKLNMRYAMNVTMSFDNGPFLFVFSHSCPPNEATINVVASNNSLVQKHHQCIHVSLLHASQ